MLAFVAALAETELSKEVHGLFQVVGDIWDEKLMKSVGTTSLDTENEACAAGSPAGNAS